MITVQDSDRKETKKTFKNKFKQYELITEKNYSGLEWKSLGSKTGVDSVQKRISHLFF